MGTGFMYKCSKCNKEYDITPGTGMMYPFIYEEVVDKIRKGKFGRQVAIL